VDGAVKNSHIMKLRIFAWEYLLEKEQKEKMDIAKDKMLVLLSRHRQFKTKGVSGVAKTFANLFRSVKIFFLAASTECSAGSNDHFVVGVGASVPSLVQFDERPLGGANFQHCATLQRNNHATLHATEQARNLATQQSRILATQQSRNL
jgi:hypothetical protein